MLLGVIPAPCQMTDIRKSSVSKHAQHSLLRFRITPRGVRLLVGQRAPGFRASKTEEKKGNSFSIKVPHSKGVALLRLGALPGSAACKTVVRRNTSPNKLFMLTAEKGVVGRETHCCRIDWLETQLQCGRLRL